MLWKIIVFVYIIVPSVFGIRDNQIAVYDSLLSSPHSIDPIESLMEPSGYTLCLRVQIKKWENEPIISSAFFSFTLKNFSTGNGEFHNFEFKHNFNFREIVPLSFSFWNSICASFNYTDLTLILLINNQIILNLTEKSLSKDYYFKDPLDISIDLKPSGFSGLITDLNMWSRPLSVNDLYQYSCRRSKNFTESLKPDKVIWSRFNITNNTNSKPLIIPVEDLCQDLLYMLGLT